MHCCRLIIIFGNPIILMLLLMKNIYIPLFVVLLFFSIDASGQDYPEGVYMSLKEIVNKTPSMHLDVTVQELSKKRGNKYELVTDDESVEEKFFKNEVYGYSDGTDLYINCKRFISQLGYSKVLSDGKYLVFTGREGASSEAVSGMTVGFGLIGGLAMSLASLGTGGEILYVFDKDDLQYGICAVKPPFLGKLVKRASGNLFAQYKQESKPISLKVQLYYLDVLNQAYIKRDLEALNSESTVEF